MKPPSAQQIDSRVNDNFKLARFWARKMERRYGYNDALSLAMDGLLHAAKKYEDRPNVRFGTYACYMIKSRFAAEHRKQMTKSRGEGRPAISLELQNNGHERIIDTLRDEQAENPVRMVELLDRREQIQELLAQLTPHKRKILEMRYGLNGRPPMFLEEIAAVYGVTRERIRQIEAESLRRFWRYLSRKPEESLACSV